jgi:hypothetical protein
MAIEPKSILGGESVYCINEAQLEESARLMKNPRLQELIASIEEGFSRNERAALAFTLIEHLRKTKDGDAS